MAPKAHQRANEASAGRSREKKIEKKIASSFGLEKRNPKTVLRKTGNFCLSFFARLGRGPESATAGDAQASACYCGPSEYISHEKMSRFAALGVNLGREWEPSFARLRRGRGIFSGRQQRQKLTASLLTFTMLVQTIAGILLPLHTPSAHAGWYDAGYGFRKEIRVDHTKVANTNQANFPMLVSFTDSAFKTTGNGGRVTSNSGYDIIFSNAAGTVQLDHEMEKYTPTTGEISMWVKTPVLSATEDTSIYVYYGNGNITTSQEHKTAVWDDGGSNSYQGVWHLGETGTGAAGDHKDSTNFDNDSTNAADQPVAVAGKIQGAESFNGVNQHVETADTLAIANNSFTASAWFQETESIDAKILSNSISYHQLQVFYGKLRICVMGGCVAGNTDINDGQWHFATVVGDGTSVRAYLDGSATPEITQSASAGTMDGPMNIGGTLEGSFRFHGSIDEARISDTARSVDWITTEYANQSNPTEFATLGIEEVASPAALSTFAYRKAITIDHIKVAGNLTDFPVLVNLPRTLRWRPTPRPTGTISSLLPPRSSGARERPMTSWPRKSKAMIPRPGLCRPG
jgi:hypothetical protein